MKRLILLFCGILWMNLSAGISSEPAKKVRVGFYGFPISTLFYLGYDEYSEAVTALVAEPLLRLNLKDLTLNPGLAESFAIDKKGTTIDFFLNQKVTFSDGTPLTAEDVISTWNLLKTQAHTAPVFASIFKEIISCEKTTSFHVKCKSKKPLLEGAYPFTQFYVLSKKQIDKKTFPQDFSETFLGTGPYRFKKVVWGQSILLEKNTHYWSNPEKANFDQVEFLIQPNPGLIFQMLIKHEIDYLYFLSAKSWAKDTLHPLFQTGQIKKLEVTNKVPFAMAGIAWNLRRPLFQDKKVRHALALLLNRDKLIKDFFFDQYQPCTGIANFHSSYHHPNNVPLSYQPSKAQQLLAESGWKLNSDHWLEKNGTVLSFQILTGNAPASKYLAFYQEDLRKMGIKASIRVADWSTYLSLRNKGEFDAIDFSRNRDEKLDDLTSLWHSQNAETPQLGNITGLKNVQLDKLLENLDAQTEEQSRQRTIREIDRIIAEEFPMAFTWEPKTQRIAYWHNLHFKEPGYLPYSRWNRLFEDWTFSNKTTKDKKT